MLLFVASALAWDPPRVYLGGQLPITGFGATSVGSPYVVLDLAPVVVEYRLASRVGIRVSADSPLIVGIRTPQTIGAIVRLEGPIYLGDYAPQDGMRGFYIGPYLATSVFTSLGLGGGATLGISSRLSERVRIRTGLTLGLLVEPDTNALTTDISFTAIEVGGFLF